VSPWKVILATMVIFVCGVVTGALVARTQGSRPSPYASGGGFGAGGPGSGPVWEFIRRLDQAHLDLTTDQHDKIAKIMQDSYATNRAILNKINPQLQAEKERAQKAINQLLSPEQQQKFSELLKKPELRPEGRGRRGGEGGGFPFRNTNRFPSNGFPEDGRDRMGRRGQNNDLFTNNRPAINSSSNTPPTANPATNAP
jgi:Spy/CpxP family protein refolding chaperone